MNYIKQNARLWSYRCTNTSVRHSKKKPIVTQRSQRAFIRSTLNSVSVISTPWRLKIFESFSVRHAVWPCRRSFMTRQKRGNSSVHCPISLKPLSHDHNHALTRFICQYWLIVTAPLAADRKWHVLYFDALLLAGLQYTAQMSSDKSLDNGQHCDFSSNRVNIEVRRRLILCQSCRNSTVHCPISTKILSHDQSPGLNSSICQY